MLREGSLDFVSMWRLIVKGKPNCLALANPTWHRGGKAASQLAAKPLYREKSWQEGAKDA